MASPGGFLYAFRIVGTDLVKVGYTRGTLLGRLGAIQHGQPHTLEIAASLYVTARPKQCEHALHTFLSPYHHRGEWFTLTITQDSFMSLMNTALEAVRTRDGAEAWADVVILPDAPPPLPYKPFLRVVPWDVEGTDFDLDFDLGMHDEAPPPLVYASPMADDLV